MKEESQITVLAKVWAWELNTADSDPTFYCVTLGQFLHLAQPVCQPVNGDNDTSLAGL
jgi:hypothetical protein